jgi:hypothetical protein
MTGSLIISIKSLKLFIDEFPIVEKLLKIDQLNVYFKERSEKTFDQEKLKKYCKDVTAKTELASKMLNSQNCFALTDEIWLIYNFNGVLMITGCEDEHCRIISNLIKSYVPLIWNRNKKYYELPETKNKSKIIVSDSKKILDEIYEKHEAIIFYDIESIISGKTNSDHCLINAKINKVVVRISLETKEVCKNYIRGAYELIKQ